MRTLPWVVVAEKVQEGLPFDTFVADCNTAQEAFGFILTNCPRKRSSNSVPRSTPSVCNTTPPANDLTSSGVGATHSWLP